VVYVKYIGKYLSIEILFTCECCYRSLSLKKNKKQIRILEILLVVFVLRLY